MVLTPQATSIMRGGAAAVTMLRWSRDGHTLAAADTDRIVRVWRHGHLAFQESFRSSRAKLRNIDRVRALEISPGGRSLFLAAGDCIDEIEIDSAKILWTRQRPPNFGFVITCPQTLTVSNICELSMSYDDGFMEVVPPGYPARPTHAWSDNDAPVYMTYLADGYTLIGSDGHSVSLWDSRTGAKVFKSYVKQKICGLAACQENSVVAFRTLHRIYWWDVQARHIVASAPVLTGFPSLAMSSDGAYVAAGDNLGVSLFDIKGNLVDRYPQVSARTLSLAFLPKQNTLAIGSSDGSIVLWGFQRAERLMAAFAI